MNAAFIMNACTYELATKEDLSDMPRTVRGQAWSSSGELITDGKSRFSLQADFQDNPGDYVIQFNTNLVSGSAGAGAAATEADIIWSVEGNSVERKISIANGARISGCAQAVRVVVRDTSVVAVKTVKYVVAALITPGTRSSVQQPPIYSPVGGIGITDVLLQDAVLNGNIPVPPAAGVISYYMTYQALVLGEQVAITEANLSVEEINSTSNRIYSPVVVGGTWVPLTPGTTSLTFTMRAMPPFSVIEVSVVWGIDG